jgi:hypothetical protein
MNPKFYILVVALMLATPCHAIVLGGSNLDIFGYPKHKCSKTYLTKPIKPYRADRWEIDFYNSEVDRYNNEIREYYSCLKEYLDNAKNDIERIEEAYNEIVKYEFNK